jgi:hypothetical protein
MRDLFSKSVRAVFFQTEYEEFLYATHGGTLFLVRFRGRIYGLTCKHVFQDFEPGRLFVTQEKHGKKGSKPAPVKGIAFPSAPRDGAAGSDIVDVCIIEFSDDIPADFFKDQPYPIDDKTFSTSQTGHRLEVAGALKEKSYIDAPDIVIGYCRLEFGDVGVSTSDPTLRQATAEFQEPEFGSVTGISGSPVFDLTSNALCGMVVRGGMEGNRCNIYYIDIADIVHLLEGIHSKASSTYYVKNVAFQKQPT